MTSLVCTLKTLKEASSSSQGKKQGIPKKQGKEGHGNSVAISRKNPHAHKNKIGTSTPPSKKAQNPPPPP